MCNALPRWLRIGWLCLSPLAVLFAARIAWEKTLLTWSRGPQAVGFTLMHTYPLFGALGILSCTLLMVWLMPAVVYLVKRRKDISISDIVMTVVSLVVAIAIVLPDAFFVGWR
jgi:hypothetical protein